MAVSYVTELNLGVRALVTHTDRGLLLTLLELAEKIGETVPKPQGAFT